MINLRDVDVKHMTIGEMAKLNHVSEQTLRLYDRAGLLSPLERDGQNGYRYYDIRQSAQLDMIQYMKHLGIPLKKIRAYMKDWDIARLKELLSENKTATEKKIKELMLQRRAIERMLESCERYETAPPDGAIVMEFISRRQMYVKHTDVSFYDYDIDEYEKILRSLKDDMSAHNIAPIYYANAGTIIARENFIKHNIYSDEVFVFVDSDYVDERLITIIPAGFYLCMYCDRFEKEKEYIDRLLRKIADMHCTVAGDYICEVIMETPFNYKERGMFLRLQVPIKIGAEPENTAGKHLTL